MNNHSSFDLPLLYNTPNVIGEDVIDNEAVRRMCEPVKRVPTTENTPLFIQLKSGKKMKSESETYFDDIQDLSLHMNIDSNTVDSDNDIDPILSEDDAVLSEKNINSLNIYDWEENSIMDDSDSESSSEENITTLNIKLREIEDDKDEKQVWGSFQSIKSSPTAAFTSTTRQNHRSSPQGHEDENISQLGVTTPVHVDSELPATTKSDLPLDPSVYSHFPTSISSNATLQDRLYDSCHPLIVTDDTPYYFDMNDPEIIYMSQYPHLKAKEKTLFTDTPLQTPATKETIIRLNLLPNPRLNYGKELFLSNIKRCKLNYHKPAISEHSLSFVVRSMPIPTEYPPYQILKEPRDLSIMNSDIFLVEYYEPLPYLLLEASMPAQLICWYKQHHENLISDTYENVVPFTEENKKKDNSFTSTDPNRPHYIVKNLRNHERMPFFGHLPRGNCMLSLCTNLFNAPLVNRSHDRKKHDYLITWNTDNKGTCYIRPLPGLYLAGKIEPYIRNVQLHEDGKADSRQYLEFQGVSDNSVLESFDSIYNYINTNLIKDPKRIDIETYVKQYSALLGMKSLRESGIEQTHEESHESNKITKAYTTLDGFLTELDTLKSFYESKKREGHSQSIFPATGANYATEHRSVDHCISVIRKERDICHFMIKRIDRTPWCQVSNYYNGIIENNLILSLNDDYITYINSMDDNAYSMSDLYGEDFFFFKNIKCRGQKKTQKKKDHSSDIRKQTNEYMISLLKKYKEYAHMSDLEIQNLKEKQKLQKKLGEIAEEFDFPELRIFKQDRKEDQKQKKIDAVMQQDSIFKTQLVNLTANGTCDISEYEPLDDRMCFYEVYSSVMIGVLSTLQTDGTVYRQVTYSFNDKNELKIEYRYSKRRDKIEGLKARFARMKEPHSLYREIITCHGNVDITPAPQKREVPKNGMATRNHPTEEQKRLSICLRDIIDEVIRCDFARDFMTLPKKGTPWEANYRNVVKNPIDLTTIRDRAKNYISKQQLLDDLDLLYRNTKLFNGEQNDLTNTVRYLQSLVLYLLDQHREEIERYEEAINMNFATMNN